MAQGRLYAGVAHNKILAKLASGMHKPMQQTVVPAAATAPLLHDLPIPKLRQLGGKFGEEIMSKLNISSVGRPHTRLSLPRHTQLLCAPIAQAAACVHDHYISCSLS